MIDQTFSEVAVREFATKIGIDCGIVVGRLQKVNIIDFCQLNSLKQKYTIK